MTIQAETRVLKFGPAQSATPLVSVAMITYNHAAYIRQAIESVFEQKTTFAVEVVIGEDCSTDETREIVLNCVKDSPIPVTLLLHTRNVGMYQNGHQTLAACTGKYVAVLEGDDYWVDMTKLARQVGLLESNRDLSFCFHRAEWVYIGDTPQLAHAPVNRAAFPLSCPPILGFQEIADEMCIPTASVVYRREFYKGIPDWVQQIPWGDWVMFLSLTSQGDAAFLPEVMSVYRRHMAGSNSCSNAVTIHIGAYRMFEHFAQSVPAAHRSTCRTMVMRHLELLADEYENGGRIAEARSALGQSFWYGARFLSIRRRPVVWWLRLSYPRLHRMAYAIRSRFNKLSSPMSDGSTG